MAAVTESLEQVISADHAYLTEIRHDIHAHPELGYQEHRTSQKVQEELAKIGVEFKAGLAKGTGVLGYLPATETDPAQAPTVALRADMDALPIHEDTGLPYTSKNEGVMHACGHDGHTTILIGTARALSKTQRPNNVLLLFQPAEEGGAGGQAMCKDGVLAGKVLGKPADVIFGLHGFSFLPVGHVATRTGAMMASADGFEVRVHGQGGHAAMPHVGVDPILVASHIITALQSIASRNVRPLDSIVITIGKIEAGSASNIIPDDALLVGTLRTLNNDVRDLAQRRIAEISSQVASAFGATAEVEWTYGYPVTFNDAAAARRLRATLEPVFGEALVKEEVDPVMGAEDFSFYGREVPACFYWLGLLNEGQERYPNLHAPEFDFNDKAIPHGVRAMCALALSS